MDTCTLLFISCIGLSVTNIIALFGWRLERKRSEWYDKRGDIMADVLLEHMRTHDCPLPQANESEFKRLIIAACKERLQKEQTHE